MFDLVDGLSGFETLEELQKIFHAYARKAGFHSFLPSPERTSQELMLIASEVFEAFEEHRAGSESSYYVCTSFLCPHEKVPKPDFGLCKGCGYPTKPEGLSSELADVLIRVLDFAQEHGIDMTQAVAEKYAYNLTREPMHGKRF